MRQPFEGNFKDRDIKKRTETIFAKDKFKFSTFSLELLSLSWLPIASLKLFEGDTVPQCDQIGHFLKVLGDIFFSL